MLAHDRVGAVTTIKKRQEAKIIVARYKQQGKPKIEGTTDWPLADSKVEAMRLSKTPNEIIQKLEDDFMKKGVEAYQDFKHMVHETGISHDEKGVPKQIITEGGK